MFEKNTGQIQEECKHGWTKPVQVWMVGAEKRRKKEQGRKKKKVWHGKSGGNSIKLKLGKYKVNRFNVDGVILVLNTCLPESCIWP